VNDLSVKVDLLIRSPRTATSSRLGTIALVTILLTTVILATVPASTLGNEQGYAIQFTPQGTLVSQVDEGDRVTIELQIENIGSEDFGGIRPLKLTLSARGKELDHEDIPILVVNATTTVTFNFKATEVGESDLKLMASAGTTEPAKVLDAQGSTNNIVITGFKVVKVEERFDWTPVIVIVVIAVAALGGFMVYKRRKDKLEEQRRLEDEARRQEQIRRKEKEIAKKIEVKQVIGKHPRDYYVLRRQKYATLKPSGMTSSGLTILKPEMTKVDKEEIIKLMCPKCGTELPSEDAECPRCNATERIEAVRHQIRAYKSKAAVDFTDAETLLRKAEHRINWSDFGKAREFAEQSAEKMNESWEAHQRGEMLESTVSEIAEDKGPTLDAEVIGLEGDEQVPSLKPLETTVPVADEEAPSGEPCSECGSPMDGETCIYCDFTDELNTCWAIIEEGEQDGAPMSEMKDLCRQANNAFERGSNELGVRYLRRAKRLSKDLLESHTRSKTEGIIVFTKTLLGQVKSLDEDISMAEEMLKQAESSLAEGDFIKARSLAAKADGYLKQLMEDSFRKQANELLSDLESRPVSSEVKGLIDKAKKLIQANEFEGAVGILETAKSKQ
jgi:hypothetical protein